MSFLKTTFQSPQYNAIQGFSNSPRHKLQLIEDADGTWFIHIEIKSVNRYSPMIQHFNLMEEVDTINFKPDSLI